MNTWTYRYCPLTQKIHTEVPCPPAAVQRRGWHSQWCQPIPPRALSNSMPQQLGLGIALGRFWHCYWLSALPCPDSAKVRPFVSGDRRSLSRPLRSSVPDRRRRGDSGDVGYAAAYVQRRRIGRLVGTWGMPNMRDLKSTPPVSLVQQSWGERNVPSTCPINMYRQW
jgi:hypothetical protein